MADLVLSDGYNPDFDIDNGFGRQGELFVADILASLGTSTYEVKTERHHNTRMYVELEHQPRRLRRDNRWEDSGLRKTKADLWVYVHGRTAFVVPTGALRECVRRKEQAGEQLMSMLRGDNPTRGYVLQMAWVMAVSSETSA